MIVARALIALVIALAVALLPATIGAAPKLASTGMSISADMDAVGMHDCCPDPDVPCDEAMKDCPFMAACILKNFNFAVQGFSRFIPLLVPAGAIAVGMSEALVTHGGSPPLHPPQV